MLPRRTPSFAELQSDLYVKLRCLCEKTIIERLIDTTTSDKSKTEKNKKYRKPQARAKSSCSPVAFYLSLLLVRILHAAKYHVIAVISIIQ